MVSNATSYKNIRILNGTWYADISERVISADLDMTVGQVSELALSVDDPNFSYYRQNNIPMDTWVNYEDLKFAVAAISLDKGGGEGGFTLQCRPRSVRALKNLKGALTLSGVSPSMYVQDECRRAGVGSVVQPSAKRSQVARDVTEPGQQGTDQEANAWTTFARLADELGYIVFENAGTIYFGQPTWFVQNLPVLRVTWGQPNSGYEVIGIPSASTSLDNKGRRSLKITVPLERAADFRPGRGMYITGIPRFDGLYFITSVNFPLAGPGEVSVSAETPFNPEPQEVV